MMEEGNGKRLVVLYQ